MDILQILTGMSPWWWVIAAFALGSIEMATMTFFLIWPGLAALCMAGILVLAPNMSGTMQIFLFAIISITLTFIGRYLLKKYGDGGEDSDGTLNNRAAQLVGRSAKVLEFERGFGVVEVNGMRWRAEWPTGQVTALGESVRITKSEPLLLYVENPA